LHHRCAADALVEQALEASFKESSYDERVLLAVLFVAVLPQNPPVYWTGGDMSFLPQYQDLKAEFKIGGEGVDPLALARATGSNTVRLRVWVNPKDGYCSKEKTLAMAKAAWKHGLSLMINFHYSDWWADPGHQVKPKAWEGLSVSQIAEKVEEHTFDVLNDLVRQGTPADLVQVGNEIRTGMIWPEGQLWTKEKGNNEEAFTNLVTFLKAGCRAVRRIPPTKDDRDGRMVEPKIIIHNDAGGDSKNTPAWYEKLAQARVPMDYVGLSYYPWWHGSLDDLRKTMSELANQVKTPMIVVETAYPFTLDWKDSENNFVGKKDQLHGGFDATPFGQAKYLRALHATVKNAPGGLGRGVIYWAPEYVAHPGIQTPYENLCLFDFKNEAILESWKALGGK
jgi:arabinogalactan endo-1,4-beta-galactosidase